MGHSDSCRDPIDTNDNPTDIHEIWTSVVENHQSDVAEQPGDNSNDSTTISETQKEIADLKARVEYLESLMGACN